MGPPFRHLPDAQGIVRRSVGRAAPRCPLGSPQRPRVGAEGGGGGQPRPNTCPFLGFTTKPTWMGGRSSCDPACPDLPFPRVWMQPLMSPPQGLPDGVPAARPCPSTEHVLQLPLRAHRLSAPRWLQGGGPQAAPGPECGRDEAGGRGEAGGERQPQRRAGGPRGLGKGLPQGGRPSAGPGGTAWPVWCSAHAGPWSWAGGCLRSTDAGQYLPGAGAPNPGSLLGMNLTLRASGLGHPGGSVC